MSKLYADLVLLNGKIVTVDEEDSVEEAVAVKFGRILAVGKNDEIRNMVGESSTPTATSSPPGPGGP